MKQSEMNRIFGQEMEALNMVLADCVRSRQKSMAMIAANRISGAASMACALGIIERGDRDEISRNARVAAASADAWEPPETAFEEPA